MADKYNKQIDPSVVPNEFSSLDGKDLEQLIALKDQPVFQTLISVLSFLEDDARARDWMSRSFKNTDEVFNSGVRHGQVAIIQLLREELWGALDKELQRRKEQIDKAN